MQTLYDFGMEVQKIREAINGIEVRGSENASLIVYAVGRCNDIIKSINSVIEQQKTAESGQNGDSELNPDDEGGEEDGQPDRGTTA